MPPIKTTKATAGSGKNYWKVIAQTGRVGRKHFEGIEADARDFVVRNFPRPHVDETTQNPDNPVHDVKLVSPAGTEEVFNSKDGWKPKPDYDADNDTDGTDEDYA